MENRFSLMDVVWARARKPKSEIFWPAQVIETVGTPRRSSKKIIASVRFLGENTEEDVKNSKDIKKWDCDEQLAFIQKGRNSLKDSNAKISFNKGIKEARKLVKENTTASKGGEFMDSKESIETEKSSLHTPSTPIKFVDDKAILSTTHNVTCEVPSAKNNETCSEPTHIKRKQHTPQKRCRKRTTDPEENGVNGHKNNEKFHTTRKSPRKRIETCSEQSHVKHEEHTSQKRCRKRTTDSKDDANQDKCHGTRKSPRKRDSVRNACDGEINDKKGSQLKLPAKKSPQKLPGKVIENNTKLEKEKHSEKQISCKRKRSELEKKDSLSLLCEDMQESNLDSKISNKITNKRLENAGTTKQKGRKRLFLAQEESDVGPAKVGNGHNTKIIVNGGCTGNITAVVESDSDESSDKELMETALDISPSSKSLKFALNDVVWAKLNRNPYWPAQVKRIQKKPKKIYVRFFGYHEKRSFSCKKLQPFACNADKREEFIKEASKEDPSYFGTAFTEAEDLVRKKALGISSEPDDDEEFELVDTEEAKEQIQEEPTVESEIIIEEEQQDIRRSKRSKKQISKYNRDILSYIQEAKPILKEILEEKHPCERHKIFTTGNSKEKSALRHQSGFGPIADSELENDIVELLMEIYDDVSPKKDDFSSSTYVVDVWLPEAIIYAIQKIDRIDRKAAELLYSKGTSQSCDSSHAELFQQLKAKTLTDEDRQATIERAERHFQRQSKN